MPLILFKEIIERLGLENLKEKCQENGLRSRLMPEEIDTRWNSTYDFLKTCYIYRTPITTTFNQYASKFPELILQESDWSKINDVVIFLGKFYIATVEFSGAYYPTVCNILAYIADLSLLLMDYKQKSEYECAINEMIEKFKKYFFPIPPIYLVGAILNPCMKFNTASEFVRIIYDSLEINPEEEPTVFTTMGKANNHIFALYNHYVDLLDNATPAHTVPITRTSDHPSSSKRQAHAMPAHDITNLDVWNRIQRTSQGINREELNYYLRSPPDNCQKSKNTLKWWKNNQNQYPVLSTMARDVLNIPMSTVASESAFSQGRQQIGDNRHSLGSNAMNVLVCLRDWIRAERRNKGRPEETQEDEELEEIMSIGDPSTQSTPNYELVDFENYEPIPANVNTDELERLIQNL